MGETRMAIFPKVHRRSREFVAELKRNYTTQQLIHVFTNFTLSLLIDFTHTQNVNIILYKNKEYKV